MRSQIDVLNQDFRNKLGGVDTGIEFKLAINDDQGNKSIGIQRYRSQLSNFIYDSQSDGQNSFGSMEASLKGISQWNLRKYLNIWIVNTIVDVSNQNEPNWLAYATYPQFVDNSPQLDGLVIVDDFLGT